MSRLHTLSPFSCTISEADIRTGSEFTDHGLHYFHHNEWHRKITFVFSRWRRKTWNPLPISFFLSFVHLSLQKSTETFLRNSTSVQILRDVISNFENFCILAIVLSYSRERLIFTKYCIDLEQIWYYLTILKLLSYINFSCHPRDIVPFLHGDQI